MGDWLVPMWLEAVIIAVMGLIMVWVAVIQFRKA